MLFRSSGETPGRIFWISVCAMAVNERVAFAVTMIVEASSDAEPSATLTLASSTALEASAGAAVTRATASANRLEEYRNKAAPGVV